MKDDHEKGTHLVMAAIILLVIVLVFIAFGKAVLDNINTGNKRADTIWKASDGAYINEGPNDL